MSDSFELVVIGAGPAGLEAALAAASAGVKTAVVDSSPAAGGQYYKPLPVGFQPVQKTGTEKTGEALAERLEQTPVRKLWNAAVWGIFREEDGRGWLVALSGAGAPQQIHADQLILATGAYDTPVAFPGWTLPGVITCGAALTLLKNQRVAPFRRVLLSGTGPLLLSAAAHLIDAGVEVVGMCEANRLGLGALAHAPVMLREVGRLREGAGYLSRLMRSRTPYRMGWSLVEARGEERVSEAIIAQLNESGAPIPATRRSIAVDGVICGYGLTPNTRAAQLLGCKFEYHPDKGGWVPWRDARMQTSIPGVYCVGDCAGIGGAKNARLEGQVAGAAAAAEAGYASPAQFDDFYGQISAELAQQRRFGQVLGALFPPRVDPMALLRDDALVCRCEEITLGEVKRAVAAGARTMGEVKMITRAGMGNCQGRMCERTVMSAVVRLLADDGASPESVGRYSVRAPLQPLYLGSLIEAEPVSE